MRFPAAPQLSLPRAPAAKGAERAAGETAETGRLRFPAAATRSLTPESCVLPSLARAACAPTCQRRAEAATALSHKDSEDIVSKPFDEFSQDIDVVVEEKPGNRAKVDHNKDAVLGRRLYSSLGMHCRRSAEPREVDDLPVRGQDLHPALRVVIVHHETALAGLLKTVLPLDGLGPVSQVAVGRELGHHDDGARDLVSLAKVENLHDPEAWEMARHLADFLAPLAPLILVRGGHVQHHLSG
eukprot:scaffold1309_cov370-Pinguiococcus_pyrenoidosus.AAC.1